MCLGGNVGARSRPAGSGSILAIEPAQPFKGRDAAGALISDDHRIVPGVTYVLNQNWRATAYYEHDLMGVGGSRGPGFNDKL